MLEPEGAKRDNWMVMEENRQCPYCDLVFEYHNEVKEHILLDHAEHAGVVAGIEPHELPHA